jgi:hypothetical protein
VVNFVVVSVHVLFAVTLVAPMFSPFFVLGIVGASFSLPDTLTAVAIILGIRLSCSGDLLLSSVAPSSTPGLSAPAKGLTNRSG